MGHFLFAFFKNTEIAAAYSIGCKYCSAVAALLLQLLPAYV